MNRQRIITALVLVPLALLVVLGLPEDITALVFAALVLLGAWEWSAFLRPQSRAARIAYVAMCAIMIVLARRYASSSPAIYPLLIGAALWWLIAFAWVSLFPTHVSRGAAMIAGVFVLVPAWVALTRLHAVNGHGPQLVLFLLVLVWAADVGAYVVGRWIGKTKLAPRVSPGKTWEGVLGGLIVAMLFAALALPLIKLPALPFLSLCCAVVMISVIGDLTESLFKRYAGVKDSGTLFPGHGGVLDRIDSVTAAAPFFVLGLGWLGYAL